MDWWTTLFLLFFLAWSYFCFRAGFRARGEEDLARYLSRIIPPRDDDDPPEKVSR